MTSTTGGSTINNDVSIQPCTVSSALVPVSVSFEQMLPLLTSKRTRPKPPAYELIGDATHAICSGPYRTMQEEEAGCQEKEVCEKE